MRRGMIHFWVVPTNADAWDIVKTQNVYAFQREPDRDKLQPGDKLLMYLIGSEPPVFVGMFEIAGSWEEAKQPFWPPEIAEGKVIYPWRFKLTPLQLGAVNVRALVKRLSFIEDKTNWSAYLIGSLANFQRPVPESDYLLIHEALHQTPVAYEIKAPTKKEAPRIVQRRKLPLLRGQPPGHNELRDVIHEIGLMKGVISEVEYTINDMRLDVAWRTTDVRENPDHAWEVQIAGNFFEALAKLKHAWDLWRADPFLVTTGRFEEEAKRQLGGTFHEIRPYIRIVNWRKIVALHTLMKQVSELEKDVKL